MPNLTTRPGRRGLALLAVIVLSLGIAACSDGDDDSSGGGSSEASDEARSTLVEEANTICTEGKERTAAIATGTLVVPDPSTEEEEAATDEWAQATAADLEQTADALAALEAEGEASEQRDDLVEVYREAIEELRSDGGAVLGDVNFLSDDALHSYGFTTCVSPEKASAEAESDDSTTSTTEG